jgi:hypothetical protein
MTIANIIQLNIIQCNSVNKIKNIKIDICNEGTFSHEVGPYFNFLLNFKNVQLNMVISVNKIDKWVRGEK